MKTSAEYIGRFAPSPSGPLHMGSLLCALISYLDAKSQQGQWLLRIDDVDTPRIDPKFSSLIIQTLEAHGLEWDKEIVYQSNQSSHYQDVLDGLVQRGIAFPCSLSRRVLREQFQDHHLGKQMAKPSDDPAENAWRVDLGENSIVQFEDVLLGAQSFDLSNQGAFVVKRRDGIYAYHLACVVDDYLSGITHIVRGEDLLESTAVHVFLQQMLGYPQPVYAHHFLLGNEQGQKLSKQHYAAPVEDKLAFENVTYCLSLLDLHPDASLTSVSEMLSWAVKHWSLQSIRGKKQVTIR